MRGRGVRCVPRTAYRSGRSLIHSRVRLLARHAHALLLARKCRFRALDRLHLGPVDRAARSGLSCSSTCHRHGGQSCKAW